MFIRKSNINHITKELKEGLSFIDSVDNKLFTFKPIYKYINTKKNILDKKNVCSINELKSSVEFEVKELNLDINPDSYFEILSDVNSISLEIVNNYKSLTDNIIKIEFIHSLTDLRIVI